ncbi:hypothetical protein CAEBREN_32274 [Caenorhabditis brenneri]|uniref:Uncharacterized protein n=1 Tax=Caenorhabditis brenneri TaxID=135651 RepID=G0NFE3_CAEBE|nr:hypothetical protein CAEBREN_32274 [Caenorhabditis brenneri]
MFSSQATSGLGSGTPVTNRYEDFEELVDDIKRQLEAKRLASSIPGLPKVHVLLFIINF